MKYFPGGATTRPTPDERSTTVENPSTWGEAERVVDEAMRRATELQEQGLMGLSVARQVTDALREHGLLVEHDG